MTYRCDNRCASVQCYHVTKLKHTHTIFIRFYKGKKNLFDLDVHVLFNRSNQVSNVFSSINVQFATAETGFDCAKTGFEIEQKSNNF